MKKLIEEIEKMKDNEVYDTSLDIGFQNTLNNTIDKCIELLNQYNIITAPKSIKLSEIVKKLKEVYIGLTSNIVIERKGKHILILNNPSFLNNPSYGFKQFIAEINMNNNNIKGVNPIVDISQDCFSNSLKWLYALWIAETEIIDDLKEIQEDEK